MTNFSFWQRWLLVLGIIITVFGIAIALLSGTQFFNVFNHQIDPVFWSEPVTDTSVLWFQHWLYGVWGATIAGWGVFILFVVRYPFKRKERWAWQCLAAGILLWYILDTALSAIHAVYFNVIFNTVLLIGIGIPLLVTRKDFS